MRRVILHLVIFLMCISLLPIAHATGSTERTTIEEYTWGNALDVISHYGLEGYTYSVKDGSISFWLYKALSKGELSSRREDAGYLAIYGCSDCILSIIRQEYDATLDEYLEAVLASGYDNALIQPVNGRDFVVYDEPMADDTLCRVAATAESSGAILEFVFIYKDDGLDTLIDTMIASIRCAEGFER